MFSHSDRYIFKVGLFSLRKFKELSVGQNLNSRQYRQIILQRVGQGSDSFHLILYQSNNIGKDQKVNKNLRRVNKPPSSATATISKIINIWLKTLTVLIKRVNRSTSPQWKAKNVVQSIKLTFNLEL